MSGTVPWLPWRARLHGTDGILWTLRVRHPKPSALVFDLGVFSVVVGATVLILTSLAHQSVRSHRAPQKP